VNTDLEHFRLIVPCGITDKGVTSMARLLGRRVEMVEVEEQIARQFGLLFDGVSLSSAVS
jgi:lipoyl(octanoyl) transferase